MQPLQICIGSTIRIGRESWCLPYARLKKKKYITDILQFTLSLDHHIKVLDHVGVVEVVMVTVCDFLIIPVYTFFGCISVI